MADRRRVLALLTGASLAPRWPIAHATSLVTRIPISLARGRLVAAVRIGKSAPLTFALDSGASVGLVTNDIAKELSLAIDHRAWLGSAGGRRSMPIVTAPSLSLEGGLSFRNVSLAMVSNGVLGTGIAGSVAITKLVDTASLVDIAGGAWRIWQEGSGPDRTGFDQVGGAARHAGGAPRFLADALLDGQRLRLLIDTGAPRPLLLYGRASSSTGLWNDKRAFAPFRPSGATGDGMLGRIVRANRFELGKLVVRAPLVALDAPGTRRGVADGVVGLPLLRQLHLILDPTHGIWVRPTGASRTPARYCLAGVWIESSPIGSRVREVGRSSPAADAGLQPGDEIIAPPFDQLCRALGGQIGSTIRLNMSDGSARMLVLRDYL